MGNIAQLARKVLLKIPEADRQQVEELSILLDKTQDMALLGASAVGSPTMPIATPPPSGNPKYFRLSGEAHDASMIYDAGMFWYSDNLSTLVTQIDNAGYIFNEQGSDIDFRIEGDADTQLFNLDAGSDVIAMGGAVDASFKLKIHGATAIDGDLTFVGAQSILTSADNLTLNPGGLLTFSKGLSGNWDAGGFEIRSNTFQSDVATTTAPFIVASTTVVTNLNADLLDGSHASAFVLHSLADAANDFLVASGADTFVKKTLAETGAILEGDIDHGNIQGLDTGADHSYIDQDVKVAASPTFSGLTLEGNQIIDNTATEALLVRKNADGGDVFNVDTTNVRASVGIAAGDGTFHVHTGSAGTISADDAANDLVLEDSAAGGITLLTPDASNANFYFGSPSDNVGAFLRWKYDDSVFYISTHKAGASIRFLTATGVEAMRIISNQDVWLRSDLAFQQASTITTTAGDLTLLPSANVTVGGASPTNATLFSVEDGLTFKESSAPTADAGYVKLWSTTDNELFLQSGDGNTHLLHGDAFSNIWFHGSTTGSLTVEVVISAQNAFAKVNSFTVVGHEDDLANVVGSSANDNLTLSSTAGGEYEISFHASMTATGGADKEMVVALGITYATAKDITDVTDDTVTPIVITSTAHGLEDGEMVEIVGVLGNAAANGSFIVDGKTDNTFKIVKLDGTATTGNGDFDAGSPTGDITIEYPGNMTVHRMVRGADLGALSATGLHVLANSDVLSLYVANLDGTTNLTVGAVSLDAFRIGD